MPGITTLPGLLKSAGYQTSLVGKWHLGFPQNFSPLHHGYDAFWGIRSGGVNYFSHTFDFMGEKVHDLWDGEDEIEEIGYLTNLLADQTISELKRLSASTKPYLLSLHFTAPHWPWEGPGDEANAARLVTSLDFEGGSLATYQAMVKNMDMNIGRLLAALKETGQQKNTIVVFTSDNGGERFSKMWPFSGRKGELLEGGIRVPLIIRWPAKVDAGTRTDAQIISMDFLTTFAELAGLQSPAGDGQSFADVLQGGDLKPRSLYWRHFQYDQAALRDGNWKYLRIAGNEYLFNIARDPAERANKRTILPDKFEQMKTRWAAWNETMLPYPENTSSWDNKRGGVFPDRY